MVSTFSVLPGQLSNFPFSPNLVILQNKMCYTPPHILEPTKPARKTKIQQPIKPLPILSAIPPVTPKSSRATSQSKKTIASLPFPLLPNHLHHHGVTTKDSTLPLEGESLAMHITPYATTNPNWKSTLPTANNLKQFSFGKPDPNPSFTQEVSLNTIHCFLCHHFQIPQGAQSTKICHGSPTTTTIAAGNSQSQELQLLMDQSSKPELGQPNWDPPKQTKSIPHKPLPLQHCYQPCHTPSWGKPHSGTLQHGRCCLINFAIYGQWLVTALPMHHDGQKPEHVQCNMLT